MVDDDEYTEHVENAIESIKLASGHESRHAQAPPQGDEKLEAAVNALHAIESAYLPAVTDLLEALQHVPPG